MRSLFLGTRQPRRKILIAAPLLLLLQLLGASAFVRSPTYSARHLNHHHQQQQQQQQQHDQGNGFAAICTKVRSSTGNDLLLPVPAFTQADETWSTPHGLAWTQLLLSSFQNATGVSLLPDLELDQLEPEEQARALFYAPRVVVSHQTQDDPVLSYGNRRALTLWEMDLPTLTSTPSRLTAEPVAREERARLLALVAEKGFIENYQGVRISSLGKRFMIQEAVVWEVYDAQGIRRGQAATFDDWREDLVEY